MIQEILLKRIDDDKGKGSIKKGFFGSPSPDPPSPKKYAKVYIFHDKITCIFVLKRF